MAMAGVGEALVSVVLKQVLRKLGSAVGEQIKARWKLEQDIEDIKTTLGLVQAVLRDAERRSVKEEAVGLWLKMLKNAAYDISDMFDEFEIKLSKGKISSSVAKFNMGKRLKNVREKLKKIVAQRIQFGFILDACSSSTDQEEIDKRQTTSKINKETIVGRQTEKEEIVKLLKSDDEQALVIPIFGFGGIGKTTLAKLVFNDDRMQGFDLRIWVYVSPHFDLKMIGKSVISQVKPHIEGLDDLQSVNNYLEQTLGGRSCLIVLDDVWESNGFQLAELMLMLSSFKEKSKIRIIVTTRTEEVARNIGTITPYKLKPLSDDHCWTLFKQIAFQSGCSSREDKNVLEKIGWDIAKKCKGVPMAAQAIGFILRNKKAEEWESVRDDDVWDASSTTDMLPTLKLSYYQMPTYLKLCFSYCSVFPKGCEIHKSDLIQQWISLGFVQSSHGEHLTLEKIGENYVNELLEMSFLQYSRLSSSIAKEDTNNSMLLSMHDLIYDLARSVLGDELLFMDGKKGYGSGNGNHRYALVVNCASQMDFCSYVPTKIRALHLFDCGAIHQSLYSKSLRVLDLSKFSNGNFPESIGRLKQLRYLGARGMQHESIPERVTSLSKLMYLNISGSSRISTLPKSINKLRSLLCLDLSGSCNLCLLPESMSDLMNLSHLYLAYCSLLRTLPKSVGMLKSLLHLDLRGCISLCSLSESFGELINLSHLDLTNCTDLCSFPKSFGRLRELQYLNLSGCFRLNLWFDIEAVCCLTKLQYLNLSHCSNLMHIPESVNNLKGLHTLDLSRCHFIEIFPKSLCEMTNLKFVLTQGCSPQLQQRVRECQFQNDVLTLPKFIVQRTGPGTSSNISRLQSVYPAELEIECLENVTSIEEAKAIDLANKSVLDKLVLAWTPAVKHFVDDEALLRELQPPENIMFLKVQGYMATSFSGWIVDQASCLLHLVYIEMVDLPRCEHLPPFGQLQNLEQLVLKRMPIFRKLGTEICGGGGAFKKLKEFTLVDLGDLEEWVTKVPGNGEFMFPSLHKLEICRCPKLRLKPCLHRAIEWRIEASDSILASHYDAGSSSSLMLSELHVANCQLRPNEWSLLKVLPTLEVLEISNYQHAKLPEGIGFLVSLRSLKIEISNHDPEELYGWLLFFSAISREQEPVVFPFPQLTALENLEIYVFSLWQILCKKHGRWTWQNIKSKETSTVFEGELACIKKEEGQSLTSYIHMVKQLADALTASGLTLCGKKIIRNILSHISLHGGLTSEDKQTISLIILHQNQNEWVDSDSVTSITEQPSNSSGLLGDPLNRLLRSWSCEATVNDDITLNDLYVRLVRHEGVERELGSIQKEEGESLSGYIDWVKQIADDLTDAGKTLCDKEIVTYIVCCYDSGLTSQDREIIMSCSAGGNDDITLNDLYVRIVRHEDVGRELGSIRKEEGESLSSYIDWVKQIADGLTAAGKTLCDKEIINYILWNYDDFGLTRREKKIIMSFCGGPSKNYDITLNNLYDHLAKDEEDVIGTGANFHSAR